MGPLEESETAGRGAYKGGGDTCVHILNRKFTYTRGLLIPLNSRGARTGALDNSMPYPGRGFLRRLFGPSDESLCEGGRGRPSFLRLFRFVFFSLLSVFGWDRCGYNEPGRDRSSANDGELSGVDADLCDNVNH